MNVFDYVNNISYKKNDLEVDDKLYNKYIINMAFSIYRDTIFIANESNKLSFLSNEMHYAYLLNKIPKQKRWAKWPKKEKSEDIKIIQQYFGYSVNKSISVLSILTDEQLKIIKKEYKETYGGG